MKFRNYFFTAFILLLSQVSMAAAIKFTATITKNPVTVGELFQVNYIIENASNVQKFVNPPFTPFNVIQGPFQSNSSSWVNGVQSSSVTLTYVLQATKEGTFTIPPGSAVTGNGNIESNNLVVQVTKAAPQPNAQSGGGQAKGSGTDLSKNIFLRIIADKTSVYEGEQITVSYKLYTNVSIVNYQINKMPSLNGFWSQEYTIPQGVATQENLNGTIYNVVELKRVALFPQQSGSLQLDPAQMKVTARVKTKKRQRSQLDDLFNNPFANDPFFNDPFFSAYEDVPYTMSSGTLPIQVKPLPGNKPATFNGAVGRFSLSASADKNNASTDDAITYKATITGTGNLPLMDNPTFAMSPDFEVYDPKVSENIPKNANPVSGSKTYEYVLVPRVAGDYKIPEMQFSYFDLDKHDYVTLASPAIPLVIKQGKNTGSGAMVNGMKKEDLKLLNEDIRFIKTNKIALSKNETDFFGSWMMYLLTIFPFAGAAGVWFWKRKEVADSVNFVQVKNKKALKLARKKLAAAEKWMKQNNEKAFYDEVQRSLWGYVSDKFNVQTADLSKEAIQEQLISKNVSAENISGLFSIIDNCEMALYAPSAIAGKMAANFNSATDVIVKLEQQL